MEDDDAAAFFASLDNQAAAADDAADFFANLDSETSLPPIETTPSKVKAF